MPPFLRRVTIAGVDADPPPVLEYRTADPARSRRNWRDGATPIILGVFCWFLTLAFAGAIWHEPPARDLPRPLRSIPRALAVGVPIALAVTYFVLVALRKLGRPRLYFLYAGLLALAVVTLARLLEGP
jgi:hypothetical protein